MLFYIRNCLETLKFYNCNSIFNPQFISDRYMKNIVNILINCTSFDSICVSTICGLMFNASAFWIIFFIAVRDRSTILSKAGVIIALHEGTLISPIHYHDFYRYTSFLSWIHAAYAEQPWSRGIGNF